MTKIKPLTTHQMARLLRLATITNVYHQGLLTEAEARDLLAGNLSPDDPSTYQDDRDLLGYTFQEAVQTIAQVTPEELTRIMQAMGQID